MKTIEEAAKECADNNFSSKCNSFIIKNSFIAGVEFSQQWKNVDDELPERQGDFNASSLFVLVKTDISFIRIAQYNHRQKKWYIPGGKLFDKELGKIIYWRPIELK